MRLLVLSVVGAMLPFACSRSSPSSLDVRHDAAPEASVSGQDAPADASLAHDVMLPGTAIDVAVGEDHGCLLTSGKRVACWGYTGLGATGVFTALHGRGAGVCAVPRLVPALTDIVEVVAAPRYTCTRDAQGAVHCFGGRHATPRRVEGVKASGIALGEAGLCAIAEEGRVLCSASAEPQSALVEIPGLAPAESVHVGADYACANQHGGSVACWDRSQRPRAVALRGSARSVAVGAGFACALLDTGAVACWGRGERGQLGHTGAVRATTEASPVYVRQAPNASRAVSVRAGRRHACLLREDGRVECWGDVSPSADRCPLLGTERPRHVPCTRTPTPVAGIEHARSIAAGTTGDGSGGVCAVTEEGLRCVGVTSRNVPGRPDDALVPALGETPCDPATDALPPEGVPLRALRAHGRCLRDGLRCEGAPTRPVPPCTSAPADAIADLSGAVGRRVALTGTLHRGPTRVPDVYCGDDCCARLESPLQLRLQSARSTPAAATPNADDAEDITVALEEHRSARSLACTGDESLLCCPVSLDGRPITVAGVLRRAVNGGLSLAVERLCAPAPR